MKDDYHLQELRVALDPAHPAHVLPPADFSAARVLDVGCGAGQTLIAMFGDRVSFGMDPDFAAVRQGKSLTNGVQFVCGRAEALPYRAGHFDLVIGRLSLPYVEILPALGEIRRVLRNGGIAWLMLHSFSVRCRWLRDSSLREKVFFGYVALNSVLFHLFQRQISFFGRQETFQTKRGISRALRKSGFDRIAISNGTNFIVTAVAADRS